MAFALVLNLCAPCTALGNEAGTFSQLHDAITAAITGAGNGETATITLDKNYRFNPDTDDMYYDGIVLDTALSIEGDGHTNYTSSSKTIKIKVK